MVRCKFNCDAIIDIPGSTAKQFVFLAAWDSSIPENERFLKMTPTGKLEVTIDNPVALDEIRPGSSYYLDLSRADK